MIFSWNSVPDVLVLIVSFVLDRQLCADVDSFQLYFVVDFVKSQDAGCFSASLELTEDCCQYLVDFRLSFGLLALDPLVQGGVGAPESLIPSLGIVDLCYFL